MYALLEEEGLSLSHSLAAIDDSGLAVPVLESVWVANNNSTCTSMAAHTSSTHGLLRCTIFSLVPRLSRLGVSEDKSRPDREAWGRG